ncbi:MAG: hypothetical protein HY689_15680 [Chloroflexi bacterium]|nr:hypothetical protein [Chloroflexota bacterium]
MDRARLIQDLHGIVGHDGVLFAPEDLLVYEYDGSIDRGLPSHHPLPLAC